MAADAKVMDISMYPMSKLHSNTEFGWSNSSDPKYAYILSGIALLILIIACINYIALALTSASARTLEVGVRKSIGASRQQLVRQYWSESLLSGILATVIGLLLLKIFLPVFNELTGKHFTLTLSAFLRSGLFLLIITLFISFITGGYPAIFLASFKPSIVLKNRNTYKFKPGLIKGLVVVQFALSAFLFISATVMFRQMKFISTKDLGYDKEQVVVIPTYTGFNNEGSIVMERYRTRLENDQDIIHVSGVSSPPSNSDWSLQGFDVEGKEKKAYVYRIDYDFIPTMGIELVNGRNISRDFSSDTTSSIIVNEALVKDMEWDNPIGQQLPWLGEEEKSYTVIGVVKDFNFLSLENKIQPMIMYASDYDKIRNVVVKINPGSIQSALGKMESAWKEVNPGKPFDFYFLGDSITGQYANYQRWQKIMSMSTIMAIIIACLGLFGLSGILALNKTKEIGIRKVFGADTKSLLIMLNRDIVILSVLSFLIALPVAWFIMKKWLQNFEYRIPVSWDIPVFAISAVFLVALLTVSYHSIKAAISNPVKSLRTE